MNTKKRYLMHKKRQRWVYVILGILIMMCLGTVYSYSIFRGPIEELYQAGTMKSGFPYMTSLAFYSIFMCITGRYLDYYKPRTVIWVGSVLVVLGWVTSALATSIFVLTLTYGVISGAGVGIVYGAPMSVVAQWFPEKKGFTVGLVLVGFGLSPLVTAPMAGRFIEMYGIKNTFLIIGISFSILLPLLSLSFRYPTKEEASLFTQKAESIELGDEVETKTMIVGKSFKGLYGSFIVGAMIGLMLVGMTSSIGREFIGLSSKEVAGWMSIFAIFNGIGRPMFGWIADKISAKKAMLISYVLILVASVLMLVAVKGSTLLYVLAFSIYWLNLGGWLAIAPAATISMYGVKHYSQNYGVVFTAYGIAAVIGVVTSGIIVDYLKHYHYVFYFIIGLCMIGALTSQRFLKSIKS